MADEAFEAAVAMLSGAPAPTPEAPAVTPAPVPTPAPTPEAAPTEATPEAPAAAPTPAPVEDAEAKLRADLEARRVQRQQRQPQVDPAVAAMQAKIAELESKLTTPQQANLQALIAEHGEVEALRKVGIDPLQFFDGFRKRAQQQNPAISQAERTAIEAKQTAEQLQKRFDEQQAAEQQRQRQEAMSATEKLYLETTNTPEWEPDPGLKLEYIHKLPAAQRLDWTHKTMAHWRDGEGVDISHLTDRQLAKLTDMFFRDQVASHLTGTDAGSKPPTTVPVNDGAKTKQQPAASLTNAVASQVSGRERPMTDEELFAASVRVLENRQ
jgi:hypothetical protein